MEYNKITAEEQGTGKLGKLCSARQKWFATSCLLSGRHGVHYLLRSTIPCSAWLLYVIPTVRVQLG